MDSLAGRIKSRLKTVGLSASAASLEAGLGKSAIQDILNGNSASPRLDTLEKLTGPLQCSLTFLVGGEPAALDAAKKYFAEFRSAEFYRVSRDLESGVFRKDAPPKTNSYEPGWDEFAVAEHPRFPGGSVELYLMKDSSLSDLGILANDILIAQRLYEHWPLRAGQIVIVERRLDVGLQEWTARVVQERTSSLVLASRSTGEQFESYEIPTATFGAENAYEIEGGHLSIQGIVTSLHRDMPTI